MIDLTPSNTLVVVFNGGFGNRVFSRLNVLEGPKPLEEQQPLLLSWLPDLTFLRDAGFSCVFSCANDFADEIGETGVHRFVLGSEFLLRPKPNPFRGSSVVGDVRSEWFCANHSLYAVRGRTSD